MDYFSIILGMLFVVAGIVIFVKGIFGISVSLVKIALTLFFIYLGISLIAQMPVRVPLLIHLNQDSVVLTKEGINSFYTKLHQLSAFLDIIISKISCNS